MTPPGYILPNGLLIILHLHLLDYPLQDATGYDERLFDASRGMRERNKAMEEICYFLVEKIERSKERARSILPTHPCLQQSDTAAFRIALAKYIEAIRNSITHTTHAGGRAADLKGKPYASSTENDVLAWWWKDVVVRKSILDECCGERFERLILALSSHAVLKNTTRSPSALHSLSEGDHAILGTLPKAYTARLVAAQNERLEWERSAALLIQRQADLAVIRAQLADPSRHASSSKYSSLETSRLLALRDARRKDHLRGSWVGDDGQSALLLATSLAGLLDSTSTPYTASEAHGQDAEAHPLSHLGKTQIDLAAQVPSSLPIAAARHPSHLHELIAPLFAEEKLVDGICGDAVKVSTPPHAISQRLAAIEQAHMTLEEALSAAQGIRTQLQRRLQQAKSRSATHVGHQGSRQGGLKLDLSPWKRRMGQHLAFKSPESTSSLFDQFGLTSPPTDNAIEDQIAYIRSEVLPPFVAAPVQELSPEAEQNVLPSRLPQAASRIHANKSGQAGRAGGPVTNPGRRVQVAQEPLDPEQGRKIAHGKNEDEGARIVSRRLSRRASLAQTRRSTMFPRGEDAEVLKIVASVQDRSDSEESDEFDGGMNGRSRQPHMPRRKPAHDSGTRGTLLSTTRAASRQSYDIDVHEHAADITSLPSHDLPSVARLDNDSDALPGSPPGGQEGEDEVAYEGNSMTLADILLHAARQGNPGMQLLGEEIEEEVSDWE